MPQDPVVRQFNEPTMQTLLRVARWYESQGIAGPQSRSRKPIIPDRNGITVENVSGEAIPPYGCMKVTGAVEVDINAEQQRFIVEVDKPNNDGGPFLFNGPREIESTEGSKGQAQTGPVVKALVDSASTDTPAAGESWGPTDDWGIELGGVALTVYGTIRDDVQAKHVIGNSIVAESTTVKAKLSGVIDARDGDEPDSVTAEIVRYDASSGNLITTGEEITVYSWVTFDIGNANYGENIVEVTKHDDGLWWISGEDAHDDATSDTIVDAP